jgi:hypothetical protein
VKEQQAQQITACISTAPDNTDSDHAVTLAWLSA